MNLRVILELTELYLEPVEDDSIFTTNVEQLKITYEQNSKFELSPSHQCPQASWLDIRMR